MGANRTGHHSPAPIRFLVRRSIVRHRDRRTMANVPDDTTRDAQDRQDEVFRAMAPERRLEMAIEMSESAFQIAEDGIRMRHPDYSDDDVRLTGIRLRIGDALFAAAFPGASPLPA